VSQGDYQPQIDWARPGEQQAPAWEDDPVGWACWYLERHPRVYREFRRLADLRRERRPNSRMSADQILHVLRWETELRGEDDTFKINDHLSALFSRLYVLDRPEAEGLFRTRKSIFDMLAPREERRLMLAFEGVRINRRRFV
jgi:hypothetical protein